METVGFILTIIAAILFTLAAFGVRGSRVEFVALGLALLTVGQFILPEL